MKIANCWKDFKLLDATDGQKLERWGEFTLARPDPQVIWNQPRVPRADWESAHAVYHRSASGGGSWEVTRPLPEQWEISYRQLKFSVRPTGFKHTGLFPEQAVNWEYIIEKIRNAGREIEVLNLFAYTGGATVAAASAGAKVCHVDAARGMVQRARDNAKSSGLEERPIRWIVDDCIKFIEREIRRGRRYDAIIMDPPSYGRGPSGEVWKLEDDLFGFVKLCAEILSDKPLFMLINSYTTGLSPSVLTYITKSILGGRADSQEIGLPVTESGLILPCGASCRWEPK